MQKRKEIKKNSRRNLRGHYGIAGFLGILPFLISAAVSGMEWLVSRLFSIPYFEDAAHTPGYYFDDALSLTLPPLLLLIGFGILELLLTAPLKLGLRRWYLKLSAGDSPAPLEAFRSYSRLSRILKAFWLHLTLGLRRAVLWLLSSLPSLLVWAGYACADRLFSASFPWIRPLLFLTFLITFLTCQVLYFYWKQRYFLAEYLYLVYPCTMRDAVKMSVLVMKDRKNTVFSFYLSCIPLALLTMLILPAWYTLPRIYAEEACLAKVMVEQYEAAKEAAPAKVSQRTVPIPDLKQLGTQ